MLPPKAGKQGGLRVTSSDPAALAVEEGGQFSGSPWLAIPLRQGLRGVDGPRASGALFSFRTRDGRIFLATKTAAGALNVLWRLTRRVTQRRRQFIEPVVRREAPRLGKRIARRGARELTS